MYFIDRLQQVRWPYDLHVENDAHALMLAHASQDACSDVQIAVELWQGARRIAGTSNRPPETIRANWEELPVDRQETLLQIEEALLHSGTMIARSRRLRERMNSLRNEIAHKDADRTTGGRRRKNRHCTDLWGRSKGPYEGFPGEIPRSAHLTVKPCS
jgi:hypothetical protein